VTGRGGDIPSGLPLSEAPALTRVVETQPTAVISAVGGPEDRVEGDTGALREHQHLCDGT
jgi:hypothetical protein